MANGTVPETESGGRIAVRAVDSAVVARPCFDSPHWGCTDCLENVVTETSMSSEATGNTTPNVYELTCTDCTFETTVAGEFLDALDVAETHQHEHAELRTDHFVNVTLDGHESATHR